MMHMDREENESRPYNAPDLRVFLQPVTYYENSMLLPRDLMNVIFKHVIDFSDHPLQDLCSLSAVCNSWRLICLANPFLWSRMDLSQIPLTDRNLSKLKGILMAEPPNLPRTRFLRELVLGRAIACKQPRSIQFLEQLIMTPTLEILSLRDINSRKDWPGIISRSLNECRNLKALNITNSRDLNTPSFQKIIADFIISNGHDLEELNLAMTTTSVSMTLFRAMSSEFCPKLRLLDLSTCDTLATHSFDALQLVERAPNLEVLRLGNVSFRRVDMAPDIKGLKKLRELSIPIRDRDTDRNDALVATLAFGSEQISSLDLRGCSISPYALTDMPSPHVRELHMDDLFAPRRLGYANIIEKWADSLEILSLIKINCEETVSRCLNVLINQRESLKLRDLDLNASQVDVRVLKRLIESANTLDRIDLSSCRSLPRGCKGLFYRDPSKVHEVSITYMAVPIEQRSFASLMIKLDPEDEETKISRDCSIPRKRSTRTRSCLRVHN